MLRRLAMPAAAAIAAAILLAGCGAISGGEGLKDQGGPLPIPNPLGLNPEDQQTYGLDIAGSGTVTVTSTRSEDIDTSDIRVTTDNVGAFEATQQINPVVVLTGAAGTPDETITVRITAITVRIGDTLGGVPRHVELSTDNQSLSLKVLAPDGTPMQDAQNTPQLVLTRGQQVNGDWNYSLQFQGNPVDYGLFSLTSNASQALQTVRDIFTAGTQNSIEIELEIVAPGGLGGGTLALNFGAGAGSIWVQ